MCRSIFYFLVLLFIWMPLLVFGQQFVVQESSDSEEIYILSNPELKIAPYFELLIPASLSNTIEILEREVQELPVKISDSEQKALALRPSENIFELKNEGFFRGKKVVNLIVHVARPKTESVYITKNLKIKIPKLSESISSNKELKNRSLEKFNSPLSSGQWFKIPIPKEGIYELDFSYLSDTGLDVSSIDPKNIQLWGTNGWMLSELNSQEKPELAQIPIIVEGEEDGSFDNSDRVIFFGNSPHKIIRNGDSFSHEIHPYSNETFVFLTIGSSPGVRLSPTVLQNSTATLITSFTDFKWKEQELYKAEDRQKTGRYWLGQRIPATSQNQFVNILNDTIPGLIPDQAITISGLIYSRALGRTSFQIFFNDDQITQFNISPVSGGYLSYTGNAAVGRTFDKTVSPNIQNNILNIDLVMSNGDNGATGYVDYLRMTYDRKLIAKNGFLTFNPPLNSQPSQLARFELEGFASSPFVFDITNPTSPIWYKANISDSKINFLAPKDHNLRYIAQSQMFTPPSATSIKNQNLRGTTVYPDYIIITNELFKPYANELAQYRTKAGLTPLVVTQAEILNEFSGGVTDPSAIRNFMKFLWDRAITNNAAQPKYLLLFGDTTFDTKNIVDNSHTNHVLTFQSSNSLSRIGSYASDDYYGFMDDNEGAFTSNSRIDIGIGRIPSQTTQEARIALEKIYRYENPNTNGDWKNLFTFSADDDFPDVMLNRDLHVWNADGTADRMNIIDAGIRLKKIYLFDYEAEITGSGRRVPGASSDLIKSINDGTLVVNYSGHGNTEVLSDEGFFRVEDIPSLTNYNKLSLFVTATCQFGRYDDIDKQSGAELLFFAENGGAIATFTTTRIVYTSSNPEGGQNFGLNIALSQQMLVRDPDGKPSTLGDIYLRTKNTYAGSSSNSRKFILLGDPALRIGLPSNPAKITKINDVSFIDSDTVLTIKALDKITLHGSVNNNDSTLNSSFNGIVYVNILDAKRSVLLPQTLSWIAERGCYLYRNTDRECSYEVENNSLFKGSTTVENGKFTLTLVVPKDISFNPNQARIVLYASGENETAGGSFTNIRFNGINENAINDGKGPELNVFLNSETFFNGDLSTNKPKLIVELADSSGINATGTGIGHEITATIDTNPNRTMFLTEFYESALNDFSKGRIEYPMEEVPEGNYSLKVRAWDVHNNPSEETIFFEVAESNKLVIDKIYNYPNPMNNFTNFTFEHNQQGNVLEVDIRIYTLSGRPVHHFKEYITNTTSSYANIPWNGRDRDNDRLGNGTYIYVLRVTADTPEGRKSTKKIEKLVIIR